jgi:hypothetical protein
MPEGLLAVRAEQSRSEVQALDRIIALAYEKARIRLSRNKEALIRARLGKRMRAKHIETLPEYYDYLCSREGAYEVRHAVDALTANFTLFLRERIHFEVMVDQPGCLTTTSSAARWLGRMGNLLTLRIRRWARDRASTRCPFYLRPIS